MYFINYGFIVIPVSIAVASFTLRRPGWLDRIVAYHKNKLFEDFQKLPKIEIKASIQRAPPGYVDSKEWNFDSVLRLLTLIRESESARPVRRALGKLLNYRRGMSIHQSLALFPSLAKEEPNDFYYYMDSGEYYADLVTEAGFPGDEPIIVVANPVEARLPSAMISVSLLREILEARAMEARRMPTTIKINTWKPKTTTIGNSTGDKNSTTAAVEASGAGSSDGASDVTGGAGDGEGSKDEAAETTTVAA